MTSLLNPCKLEIFIPRFRLFSELQYVYIFIRFPFIKISIYTVNGELIFEAVPYSDVTRIDNLFDYPGQRGSNVFTGLDLFLCCFLCVCLLPK